jgi:hypothetical protein
MKCQHVHFDLAHSPLHLAHLGKAGRHVKLAGSDLAQLVHGHAIGNLDQSNLAVGEVEDGLRTGT